MAARGGGRGRRIRESRPRRRSLRRGGARRHDDLVELYPGHRYGVVLLANRSAETTQGELQATAERIHRAVFGAPVQAALDRAFEQQDYGDVAATVAEVRRAHPAMHLSEDYVNAWGYRLLKD